MPTPLIPDIAVFQRKLATLPLVTYQAGETVLSAASTTGRLLILKEGALNGRASLAGVRPCRTGAASFMVARARGRAKAFRILHGRLVKGGHLRRRPESQNGTVIRSGSILFLRFELLDECSEMRGDGSCEGVVLVLQALPNC
jgi:hypothetical protein